MENAPWWVAAVVAVVVAALSSPVIVRVLSRRGEDDDPPPPARVDVLAELIEALEKQATTAEARREETARLLTECQAQHVENAVMIERLRGELAAAAADRDRALRQLAELRGATHDGH